MFLKLKKILVTIMMGAFLGGASVPVFAAGGVTVSPGALTIETGKTATFTITATNTIGDVSIFSSNVGVTTVNVASWGTGPVGAGETKSVTVTVTGRSAGAAMISVKILDAATFDGEELGGQVRNVTVNVAEPKVEPPVETKPTAPSTPAAPTPTAPTTPVTPPATVAPTAPSAPSAPSAPNISDEEPSNVSGVENSEEEEEAGEGDAIDEGDESEDEVQTFVEPLGVTESKEGVPVVVWALVGVAGLGMLISGSITVWLVRLKMQRRRREIAVKVQD